MLTLKLRELLYFILEQKKLFFLIPSVLTETLFFVAGIEIQLIMLALEKEAEAGDIATVEIVLFGQIST